LDGLTSEDHNELGVAGTDTPVSLVGPSDVIDALFDHPVLLRPPDVPTGLECANRPARQSRRFSKVGIEPPDGMVLRLSDVACALATT
jgi:hypothetical protein